MIESFHLPNKSSPKARFPHWRTLLVFALAIAVMASLLPSWLDGAILAIVG